MTSIHTISQSKGMMVAPRLEMGFGSERHVQVGWLGRDDNVDKHGKELVGAGLVQPAPQLQNVVDNLAAVQNTHHLISGRLQASKHVRTFHARKRELE